MTKPSPHLHPAAAQFYEERLSQEEWDRLAAIPLSEEEMAETRDLVRWFVKRYPTLKERFAYVRRKYEEVTRIPIEIRPVNPDS